jgi:two-component system sensor histidine kinase YesM
MMLKLGKSIFANILTAFLIVVIPVYAAGFIVYNWAVAQLRQELISSQSTQTMYYLDKFRSEIQNIIKQQSTLLTDKDIVRLSAFGDADTGIEGVFAVNRVQTRLTAILGSSDMLSNVSVHLMNIGRSIHAVGSISHISLEHYHAISRIAYGGDGQLLFNGQTPISIVTSPQQYRDNREFPAYIIEAEYSSVKIRSALNMLKGKSRGGAAFINKERSVSIVGVGDEEAAIFFASHPAFNHDENTDRTAGAITKTVKYRDSQYIVTVYHDQYTGMSLVNYTSAQEIYRPLGRYKPYFWIFTALTAILALLFLYIINNQIKKPLDRLVSAFRQVESGNFSNKIYYTGDNEFKYLYLSFNSMLDRISNLIDQVYKQKILYQESQLKQFQSQINPHFLYNSYFVLYDMAINEDYENLADFARHMGTYFQYITRSSSHLSRLYDEVEHARIYANFQAHRFRNRITMEFDQLPGELHDCLVPKVILQPVVENAFEHGLKNTVENGMLRIRFETDNPFVNIIVEDNGGELSDEDIEKLKTQLAGDEDNMQCTGLINIHRRIILSLGRDSGLFVSRSEMGGLKVVLKLAIADQLNKDNEKRDL